MSNNLIVKILSAVFFLLSLFLIREIFISSYNEIPENDILLKYGILLLAVLFLFLSAFFRQTKTIYKEEKKSKNIKINNENEQQELTKSKTEEKIKNIISLTENKNNDSISEKILQAFAKEFHIVQGIVYQKEKEKFKISATYALYGNKNDYTFREGQGIPGQTAKNQKIKILTDIPEDYIQVVSGLGASSPKNVVFIPVTSNNQTISIIEIALFDDFPDDFEKYYHELNKELAKNINNAQSN